MKGAAGCGKRDRLDNESAIMMQPKRRFIWPDSLHREFVAAIFDAGLKHLVETESEHGYRAMHTIHEQATVKQIQRHVHKILAYRVETKLKDVPDLSERGAANSFHPRGKHRLSLN